METAVPSRNALLRKLGLPRLIQRHPKLFRAASYYQSGSSSGGISGLAHVARCFGRERCISVHQFVDPPSIPRFIGAMTGRSGTTWMERIFRFSFSDQLESIGERHFFWLHPFRVAPNEYLASSNRKLFFEGFRQTTLTYAYQTRFKDGAITYGGLERLLPKNALQLAVYELEKRLEASNGKEDVFHEFGNFYLWLFNCWAYCSSGTRKDWISKEPAYGQDCDHLFHLVPNARLLVLARDGRDVALSTVKAGWAPDFVSAMRRWKKSAEATRAKLSLFSKHQWLIVRFEDLTQQFEQEMAKICGFFSLEPSKIALKPRPLQSRANSWLSRISPSENDQFLDECGSIMQKLGYLADEKMISPARIAEAPHAGDQLTPQS